jgi:membrane dipeptidase
MRAVAAGRDAAARVDQTAGRALLDDVFSVDLHAHPSLVPSLTLTGIDGHREAIASGKVGAIVMAAIGDLPVLGWRPRRGICATRAPRANELPAATWQQIATLDAHAAHFGMRRILGPSDLAAVAARRTPAALLAIEGADFLEGRLDGMEAAYRRGVRLLQLVHYRVNELGDIQTQAPVHGGLTPFGREVVREANRLGILVDLAHATYEVTRDAVEASAQPVVISHTNLRDASAFARFITAEHARLVARNGGVIGAWPVSPRSARFSPFIDHVVRLVEAVGADHVGVGTDMDGVGPYAVVTSYGDWPSIPAALLARGVGRDDVAKIMGGNFRRVLDAVCP